MNAATAFTRFQDGMVRHWQRVAGEAGILSSQESERMLRRALVVPKRSLYQAETPAAPSA